MYGYIYKTRNLKNGKIYIGQKKGIFNPDYFGSGKLIRRAILKYGIHDFSVVQIASSETKEELNVLEIFYIKKYRKSHETYNISDGGLGWHITNVSDEKRKNQSISRLKFYKNPANRLKRSISSKKAAIRFKEEGKINSGHFKKGKKSWNTGKHPEYVQGENHPMYGKHTIPWNKGITGYTAKGAGFKKGSTPWNKDKKYPKELRIKMGASQKIRWANRKELSYGAVD